MLAAYEEVAMANYRRHKRAGGTYFFTVNCAHRNKNTLLTDNIQTLRAAFRYTLDRHPVTIQAVVVLPDHLHCLWQLPTGDDDYSKRWKLIKAHFSRQLLSPPPDNKSQRKRGERGLWQRRFWEHAIRGERDLKHHINYIHWNPVKHGLVSRASLWPYSSIHRHIRAGDIAADWAWDQND